MSKSLPTVNYTLPVIKKRFQFHTISYAQHIPKLLLNAEIT